MPEEALANGQTGQSAPSEPQGGIATEQGATIQPNGQNAPEAEQPLTLTKSQLDQYISDALNAQKQNWLNEAYQNTQSMNEKFEKRVNDTIAAFKAAGIETDKASAAKYLRSQDQRIANEQAKAQSQPRSRRGQFPCAAQPAQGDCTSLALNHTRLLSPFMNTAYPRPAQHR